MTQQYNPLHTEPTLRNLCRLALFKTAEELHGRTYAVAVYGGPDAANSDVPIAFTADVKVWVRERHVVVTALVLADCPQNPHHHGPISITTLRANDAGQFTYAVDQVAGPENMVAPYGINTTDDSAEQAWLYMADIPDPDDDADQPGYNAEILALADTLLTAALGSQRLPSWNYTRF